MAVFEKIGHNIKILRNAKGYSQEILATEVGKSQNWVQKVENVEVDLSVTNLECIAKSLGVSIEYLITFQVQQVFHNCSHSGTFNNCNINSEKFISELIYSLSKRQKKQKSYKLITKMNNIPLQNYYLILFFNYLASSFDLLIIAL